MRINDKNLAFELRKNGLSYTAIRDRLNIPIGTLSGWLSGQKWSKEVSESLKEKSLETSRIFLKKLNKEKKSKLEEIYKDARIQAEEEFQKYKYHPLFIAAIMLYLGEGDKLSFYNVRIANSNPLIIALFLGFLCDFCGFEKEKIKAWLLLYPDLNELEAKEFWKKEALLEGVVFNKSIVISGKSKTKKLAHGVCYLGASSRYLKEKMLVWLKLVPMELLKKEYYAGMVQW